MSVEFYNSDLLFVDGTIAMGPACCCISQVCCDRSQPDSGLGDALPTTLNSEITAYTCTCLDLTSDSGSGVQCLTGIDNKTFNWQLDDPPSWLMQGTVFCDDEGNEQCELSSEEFILHCGLGDGKDWWLEMLGSAGCDPVVAYPEPGYSCNPINMTFILPITGCVGANGCTLTIRIYE